MAARGGNGGFVEVAVEEKRSERTLATGGVAVDAEPVDIVPGVFGGGGFVPVYAIGEAGVADVFPADIVESLGAIGGAHAVHLDDDEAEFGHGLHGVIG